MGTRTTAKAKGQAQASDGLPILWPRDAPFPPFSRPVGILQESKKRPYGRYSTAVGDCG